jgi:hypothetical protein
VSDFFFEPHPAYNKHIENISFSSCGKYVVLGLRGSRYPLILPILQRMLEPSLGEYTNSFKTSESAEDNVLSRQERSLFASSFLDFASRKLDERSPLVTKAAGSALMASVTHTTSSVNLRLSGTCQGISEDIQLTRLPKWKDLSTSSAWVELPRTNEELVKIVLNKAARPWCSSSESGADCLPLVISRDQRGLKRALEGTSRHQRLLRQSTTDEREESDQFMATKRLRYS